MSPAAREGGLRLRGGAEGGGLREFDLAVAALLLLPQASGEDGDDDVVLRPAAGVAARIGGCVHVTIRAWAKRAGVPIPTTRRPRPEAPPPPPPVSPRRIPFAGCEHFRMGHRTLCTACFCAVQRGEAVLG